jgi:hypothetical protein
MVTVTYVRLLPRDQTLYPSLIPYIQLLTCGIPGSRLTLEGHNDPQENKPSTVTTQQICLADVCAAVTTTVNRLYSIELRATSF